MKKKKVMIIEDDQFVRDCMQLALELENYDVVAAENGKVALEQLEENHSLPECIVVDLMMPVMNGEEFIKEITKRERAYLSQIPVIVATAQPRGRSHRTLQRASRLLQKPLNITELYEVVDSSLEDFQSDD